MSAPIVVEGAIPTTGRPKQGLFKGIKFWVSHHVPMRLNWVQGIQNNGGKVVASEKQANYLIADHARKNAPPGSYSWKFIDDSIRKGSLQDRNDYLCTPALAPAPALTPVSASHDAAAIQKSGRTKYTEEDDSILKDWVLEMERNGEPTSGNAIYNELAAKYPHHTSQSWRDRWIKKLKPLHQQELANGSPPPSSSKPKPQSPLHPSPSTSGISKPKEKRPAPLRKEEVPDTHLEPLEEFMVHNLQSTNEPETETPQSRNPVGTHTVSSRGSKTTKPPEVPSSNEVQNETQDAVVDQVGDQDEPEQSTSSTDGQDESQSHTPVPVGKYPRITTHSSPNDAPAVMDNNLRTIYNVFLKAEEIKPVYWITLKGQTFGIWELWEAVNAQNMDPSERDWQQIAEELNFDWVQNETVPDELCKHYEEKFGAFEEMLGSYSEDAQDGPEDQQDGDEDEDENMNDVQDGDEDEDGERPEVHYNSSPPPMTSLKRSFDTHRLSSGFSYPQSPPKRRRIDRDAEVPSTPDEVSGTSRLRPLPIVSPLAKQSRLAAIDNEVEESRDIPQDLPTLPKSKKKTREPETQGFNFDKVEPPINFDTQQDAGFESQANITPSQQLRLESDNPSPNDHVQSSPTPKAKVQNRSPGTPTPRRSIKTPFRQESDEEPPASSTTNNINNVPASEKPPRTAKKRSLPWNKSQRQSIVVDSTSTPEGQAQSSLPEQPQPESRPIPVQDTPEDIIDRFCSLRYPRDIVLRALRATTWRLGDAGQVMEILKRGEELPQRTRGVWTQRDDESLKLVTSDEVPKDEKEEKKRARAKKRLEQKHGPELMEFRRKYLWEAL
ncbi:hypothetical protein M426DRAFT_315892 [Hypoxylon sp. CI-4A]|nr:hypothetical protein M426DRAFT_315892 [Hypoxylon sp. CI-4A]